jgi:hypothetical protein
MKPSVNMAAFTCWLYTTDTLGAGIVSKRYHKVDRSSMDPKETGQSCGGETFRTQSIQRLCMHVCPGTNSTAEHVHNMDGCVSSSRLLHSQRPRHTAAGESFHKEAMYRRSYHDIMQSQRMNDANANTRTTVLLIEISIASH